MHGMGDMSGMMGMMRMMEQCAPMMQSAHADGGGANRTKSSNGVQSKGVKPLLWYSRCYPH